MLGLFDSGSGGLNTVRYIKSHLPSIDLVYKIDRKNSPYGTKREQEIAKITRENIDELIDRGAERVLIACCTASSVHRLLDEEHKRLSVPIIDCIADAARSESENGRIAVVATERTVLSNAFTNALGGLEVISIAAQELVERIDLGLNDSTVTDEDENYIKRIISPLNGNNIDTLILGCTHFPSLKRTFHRVCSPLGVKHIIDSARIGALALTKYT